MHSLGMFDRVDIPSLILTALSNSLFDIKHPLMLDGTRTKAAAEDHDADKRRILSLGSNWITSWANRALE